jgi:hypothetical protein
MSIVVSAALELTPDNIDLAGGAQSVKLRYGVGGSDQTRACDRVLVGGAEQPERECFQVTGTFTFLQRENRQVTVTPQAGVDFILIKVMVREVNADNGTIDAEQEASAQLRINAV